MTKKQAIESARQFFENHTSVDTFYMTSNGKAFFNKNSAWLLASTLDDKTVIRVNRSADADADKVAKKENKRSAKK